MYSRETGVFYQIERKYDVENGKRFKVSVQIPMKFGWIDDVNFVILKGWEKFYFSLTFKETFRDLACFESEIELKNYALYGYCFSFKADGNFRFVKKRSLIPSNEITFEECWNMSVDSWSPEWLKGRTMCNLLWVNTDMAYYDTLHKNVILHPISGDNEWNIRYWGNDISTERFMGELKLEKISVIYLRIPMEDIPFTEEDYFSRTGEVLKKLCYVAHKWGICVVINILTNSYANMDNIDFKYLYKAGVTLIDTKGQFSSVMNSTDILMWQ